LNSLANLNATDFQVTISSASISALLSDTSTRLIQNPQIRSVDGQKASLKIGDRVPVATGSFQPGIGGVGINPLVNTQFQYLDVGVNIDVTPRIHANGDVTLKVAMDISSVTGNSNIGGIDQPIIGQRKIEHEVRLKEGEANLMGGMLEDLQSKSLSGIPGLAQIPLLKYLFGQTSTEHSQTETVFVLIPHIVRRQVLSTLNEQAIDVGTANAISLRRARSSGNNGPSANASPASGAGSVAVPQAATAPPEPQLMQRGDGQASFAFDPPALSPKAGSTFTVNVSMTGAQNVYSVPLQLTYDPKLLQVVNVSNGGLLSQDGQIVTVTHREDDSTGTMQVMATRPPGANGVSGQGPVLTLTFMAKAPGQSSLAIARGGAKDPAMQALPVNGAAATVTIQ
jgi:general secretion pathway protein D